MTKRQSKEDLLLCDVDPTGPTFLEPRILQPHKNIVSKERKFENVYLKKST